MRISRACGTVITAEFYVILFLIILITSWAF